jgi:mRNA-degrading endonuclease YafQ of YafQ-DinJ toxin-antitoxin module
MSKVNNYKLEFSISVIKTIKKNFKNSLILQKAFKKTRDLLSSDPFYYSLKTHKVDILLNSDVYSSRINGDWRVIWQFNQESKTATILCLEVGTHSGGNQVYQRKS